MATAHIMMTATALAAAAFMFFLVAREVHQRVYSDGTKDIGFAYAVWWYMLALMTATDVGRVMTGIMTVPDTRLYLVLAQVKIIATGFAIWGLGSYVLYLWTGTARVRLWIGVFATFHVLTFLYLFQARLPAHVEIGKWAPLLVLEGPSVSLGILSGLGAALFFLPPLVLAVALLALLPRLKKGDQRHRLVWVVISLLLFHAASILLFDPARRIEGVGVPIVASLMTITAILAMASTPRQRSRRPQAALPGPL